MGAGPTTKCRRANLGRLSRESLGQAARKYLGREAVHARTRRSLTAGACSQVDGSAYSTEYLLCDSTNDCLAGEVCCGTSDGNYWIAHTRCLLQRECRGGDAVFTCEPGFDVQCPDGDFDQATNDSDTASSASEPAADT